MSWRNSRTLPKSQCPDGPGGNEFEDMRRVLQDVSRMVGGFALCGKPEYLVTLRVGTSPGGPAACAAPAGSRSDKKPRHPRSIVIGAHRWRGACCDHRSASTPRVN